MTRSFAARPALALLLALGVAAGAACSDTPDAVTSVRERAARIEGGDPPERRARQFRDADLYNLLLPRGAVPASLTPSDRFLLSNEAVAQLLPEQVGARAAMERLGRVQGAGLEFRAPARPPAGQSALAIGSTVSWYSTVAGAEAVIADPSVELALAGLGLDAGEVPGERVAEQSRTFRGLRRGDAADTAAYVILYRRDNLIGAVVVVMPLVSDDGGKLAAILARRQASLPLRAAP